jgi:Flp pilus assembly pilin Flp
MKRLVQLLKDDTGATAIEYALICACTGLVLVAISGPLSAALTNVYTSIISALNS